ncbi:hypothetical protein CSA17_06400 [bacterium DOLJORAL78_65_58]|nr:MAG: hypothetical protein CSA17_06400 [bacterium DOLJORAL78_65_58]
MPNSGPIDPADEVLKPVRPSNRRPTDRRLPLLLGLLFITLGCYGWRTWQSLPGAPLELTYEVDLSHADTGDLTITLVLEGDLPASLDLESPPGVFGDSARGLRIMRPSAHALDEDGLMGKPLTVDRTSSGFALGTRGQRRAGFIYHVQLKQPSGRDLDIRNHISTPVNGGVRFAGFEVFLEPADAAVEAITVTVRNPRGLPVLAPWPALVRGSDRGHKSAPPLSDAPLANAPLADAHLGYGQGYRPAAHIPTPHPADAATAGQRAKAPVPMNLFYHPKDLADLNNALLVCGHLRTLSTQAYETVIQYATDRSWEFDDRDVMDLVRRIARTEMGFFGSAPTEQITVLLAANEVWDQKGFDVYGVHTGSSVLVMLDPATTWGMLEEQAASVIAHEMFHGWLGEAITQLAPDTLWFTEGATTWYAARMLTAAGVWTPDHARRVLVDRLKRDYLASDRRGKISIADAAADVMGDPDLVRFSYAGGVAACMALDQWLQDQTGRLRPMDEVLRHLYDNRSEEGFSRAALEEAVLAVCGVDCGPWLDAFVYGREALPPVDRLI